MSGLFSFGNGNETMMHGEFMGFALDDDSLLVLRDWTERQGYPTATVQQGGPEMFAQMLGSAAPPKMALIDIDGQPDPISVTSRLASLCGSSCRLIVVGTANDVTLYRRVIHAGAVDYLVKPLSTEMLNQALAAALRGGINAPAKEKKQARLILFVGARGGVGTSTIALNTAWLIAHDFNRSTALLDLDLQFGTSSLALDLPPGRGLRDIVGSAQRVDGLMIASSIIPESENFSILGTEEPVDEVIPIDGGSMTALLNEMQDDFEAILIDLPRHMLATQKRMAVMANEIVIVSDLSLAGIRDTLRIKSAISSLACTAKVTVVAARVNATGAGQVSRAVFEKGIQGIIDATIPNEDTLLADAANKGKALGATAPRAPLTKTLRDLAKQLMDMDDDEGKVTKSFWTKLVGDGKAKNGAGNKS